MHISTDKRTASQLPMPQQTVHLIEQDTVTRLPMAEFLRENGYDVAEYDDYEEFAAVAAETSSGCAVISADHGDPGFTAAAGETLRLPVIFVSHDGDVRTSVNAMKSGAIDFLLLPLDNHVLLRAVGRALELELRDRTGRLIREKVHSSACKLTPRERQVFQAVTSGLMNKQIAYELGISEIMVKIHRGRVMQKMSSRTLPDLVRKFDMLQTRPDGMPNNIRATSLN